MSILKKSIIIFAVLATSNSFAVDLVITNKAKNAINSIRNSDLSSESGVYRIKYNSRLSESFGKLDSSFTVNKDGYLQVNKEYEYDGQCVSFAKAMTNKSGKLNPARPLTPFSNVSFGTFVATFNENGNYNNQHAAILIRIDGDKGAVLLDQNWLNANPYNDLGTLAFHYLPFSGTGNYKNDAGAYYIVEE